LKVRPGCIGDHGRKMEDVFGQRPRNKTDAKFVASQMMDFLNFCSSVHY
jgi:hypothetical protein